MDLKSAVVSYQFAERAKSELIVCSKLLTALESFPKPEQAGGRRMLIMVLEATRSELEFSWKSTEISEFRKAADLLSEAISLTESEEYGAAGLKISEAVSASTTAAQESWQVLASMESSEFLDFLTTRTSVRDYSGDDISEDSIVFILDCANTAPSAGNLESWDVVVVRDPEQKEVLAAAAYDQSHVRDAPVLFVICANYVRSMSRYGDRGILYAVQDATIACTYMMLAAHALRLSSCWVGAIDEDEVRNILSLPPHIRPIAMLTVGIGRTRAGLTGRMAIGEHVHMDSW